MTPDRLPEGHPELLQDERGLTDRRASRILSAQRVGPDSRNRLYLTDLQAVVAQPERGIGDREPARVSRHAGTAAPLASVATRGSCAVPYSMIVLT